MIEWLLVGLIVGGAVAYLVWQAVKTVRSRPDPGACGHCPVKPQPKK